MDWFLYDIGHRHEWVKKVYVKPIVGHQIN